MIKNTIIGIITTILIITFAWLYKLFLTKDYRKIENSYKQAAQFIYESNVLDYHDINEILLTRDEINKIIDDMPLSKECNGYVIINTKNKVTYKAYITCENAYQSKGFNASLLD